MTKAKNKDIRILVVDDEQTMSDSLSQHLADEGYTVDVSANGTEAIDLFDGGAHHLVICDLQLPDMDGLELLRQNAAANDIVERLRGLPCQRIGTDELRGWKRSLGMCDHFFRDIDPVIVKFLRLS